MTDTTKHEFANTIRVNSDEFYESIKNCKFCMILKELYPERKHIKCSRHAAVQGFIDSVATLHPAFDKQFRSEIVCEEDLHLPGQTIEWGRNPEKMSIDQARHILMSALHSTGQYWIWSGGCKLYSIYKTDVEENETGWAKTEAHSYFELWSSKQGYHVIRDTSRLFHVLRVAYELMNAFIEHKED